MKLLKKLTAALTAGALISGMATACSADKSWAVKDNSTTVPIGAYIYNLYGAYSAAESMVKDTSKPVLEQKIENQDATAWIRSKALTYTKSILVIDAKMKQMNLKLTDAETKQVSATSDSLWNQYSSTLEKYGIAESSFRVAYPDYYTKYQKVFDATYGKGGSKEVSDSELKNFYVKSYTDFSFIACPLYTTDSSGNFKAALSTADQKKREQEFNNYASQIKAGKMTMQQASDAYQKSSKATTTPLQNETVNLSTDTSYPQEFKSALKAMKPGEIKATEFKDLSLYILISKNDIGKKADEKLKDTSGKHSILADYKGKEFSDEIDKEASALKDVTVNDRAINSYNPSMFVNTSSAAPSSPAAGTSSAGAAAEGASSK